LIQVKIFNQFFFLFIHDLFINLETGSNENNSSSNKDEKKKKNVHIRRKKNIDEKLKKNVWQKFLVKKKKKIEVIHQQIQQLKSQLKYLVEI